MPAALLAQPEHALCSCGLLRGSTVPKPEPHLEHRCYSRCQGPPGLRPRCSGRKAAPFPSGRAEGTLPTGSDGPAGPSLWSPAFTASTVSAGLASSSFIVRRIRFTLGNGEICLEARQDRQHKMYDIAWEDSAVGASEMSQWVPSPMTSLVPGSHTVDR